MHDYPVLTDTDCAEYDAWQAELEAAYATSARETAWWAWGCVEEEEREYGRTNKELFMFHVTYREDASIDEPTHNSIVALNDSEETSTLEEVIANCTSLNCDADLFDAAGFRKGWVRRDGTYQLQ